MIIGIETKFEASHILPRHPGKCSRLHGHSWRLKVSVKGPVSEVTGFVQDFSIIKSIVQERIIDRLDHHHLGTPLPIKPVYQGMERFAAATNVYPTCENLLFWIGNELLCASPALDWYTLWLSETCTSEASLSRWEFHDKGGRVLMPSTDEKAPCCPDCGMDMVKRTGETCYRCENCGGCSAVS